MRNIGLVALAVLFLVVVLVLLVRPKGGQEGRGHELQYADLFHEACGPVSPDSLGAAWPEDAVLAAIRAEWKSLGFRDSTICEELVRNWIYPAGNRPVRLTNVSLTPTGRDLALVDRLKFGRALMRHPQWRMGSMRFFPVAAAVLSSTEKLILSQVTYRGAEPWTSRRLVGVLELPAADVDHALDELTSVGWLRGDGPPDSVSYTPADPALAASGALQFIRLTPAPGRGADYVSLTAAFHDTDALTRGRVSLWGPCAGTGRIVRIELLEGRLRRGRPGSAWAAEIDPPGLSSGLFASERAFTTWRGRHENATVGVNSTVVDFYHRTLEGDPGQ
jgi:hypothetical protein